jgi:tripartite-type tricarboxylate transporter receptor subunit TctC
MKRRSAIRVIGGAIGSLAAPALAQERLVRIVVPYAAGGQTDSMARLIAEPMQKKLGRTVIVENKPGAAALIATKYVQAMPPNGDGLLFHNSGFAALPLLSKSANYDPVTDFDAVAMVGESPNLLMVTDAIPSKTVTEFIAYAKANLGIDCANSGINSGGHISAMLFEKLAGIKLTHIPYKGTAEVARALASGEVKMQISTTSDPLNPQIKSGKVRILGTAGAERSSLVPDAPPIAESLPGYLIEGWFGLLTAAKTPIAAREEMAAAIGEALRDPVIRERYAGLYMDIKFRGPKEFAESVKQSVTFFGGVVEKLQLTPT